MGNEDWKNDWRIGQFGQAHFLGAPITQLQDDPETVRRRTTHLRKGGALAFARLDAAIIQWPEPIRTYLHSKIIRPLTGYTGGEDDVATMDMITGFSGGATMALRGKMPQQIIVEDDQNKQKGGR